MLTLLWGERADDVEREACEVLGVRELRDYFRDPRKGFFAFHIKRYSKSRRKASITGCSNQKSGIMPYSPTSIACGAIASALPVGTMPMPRSSWNRPGWRS